MDKTQTPLDEINEYIDRLERDSFEGWSEEAQKGYRTALRSIRKKVFYLIRENTKPPLYVRVLAKFIPVFVWPEDPNLAKGEIVKFNYVKSCRGKHKFNDQVVGSEDGYDMIWRHIADDWFKVVGKSHERTC
jgi:hypothetical protein